MPSIIFIIDSSPAVRRMVEQISSPQGYEVIGFQDGPTALEAARRMKPALIIADYHIANMTFSGFCKEINKLDDLAETLLVSLVDANDRPDENHLRSLGVRAFLKKPFQSEHLLDAMKQLIRTPHGRALSRTSPKKRAWPPDSTATDLDGEDMSSPTSESNSSTDEVEPLKEHTAMRPSTMRGDSPPPIPVSRTSTETGEEAMKNLYHHLVQSVAIQAEPKIREWVRAIITKELTGLVTQAVREEVDGRMASCLDDDRIKATVRDVVSEEISRQTSSCLASLEHDVQQRVAEIAPPLVEQTGERLIRQLAESSLERRVPAAVREHLGPVDQLVRNEVQQAVVQCARRTTEEVIKETARDQIRDAVQKIVPELAEAQVKEEIKRLTDSP
jgi:DNA-binding response OmpR family regulator